MISNDTLPVGSHLKHPLSPAKSIKEVGCKEKMTTHSDWTKEPVRNSHLYFRFQEDLQSQLSHSVRLYWLCEVQGLIHSTPLRLTHPAPVLRNLVLKWSSATVSLALLLLLLVPVRHLLQEFVPAKALGCIQRTRMSSASKMLRICEKGCWLECKWVASNVPSQAIVAMIHNVYNMYTNYSVHASHTTCMHLWHLPNTTYRPSPISTASALDGSVGLISTWSTVSGSTSVPRLIMERKLEKHPATVFWHSKWCPVQTRKLLVDFQGS